MTKTNGRGNPNSGSKSIEETVQVENVTTGNRPNWSRDQEQQTVIEIDSLRAIDKCRCQINLLELAMFTDVSSQSDEEI